MSKMNHLKRFLMLVLAIATVSLSATAQNQSTHTVKRGETLVSIAQMYGVTEEALRAANSGVNDLFFVGMKLQIPSGVTRPVLQNNDSWGDSSEGISSMSSFQSPTKSISSDYSDGIKVFALSYQMWFGEYPENKYRHYYGFSLHWSEYIWNNFGVGLTWTESANFGIVDFEFSQLEACLGPNLSAKLTPDGQLFALLPVTVACIAYQKPNGKYSHGKFETDMAVSWGCGILPALGVHLGRVTLMAGVDVVIQKETSSALHLSIGYNFR